MPESGTNRAIEAIWRIESPRLIASLTRTTRDVGIAEELAQDALLAALEHWPIDGVQHDEPRDLVHRQVPATDALWRCKSKPTAWR